MTNTNEARIETSTTCNYKCKFCPYHTKDFIRKKEIMSLEDYIFILKKLKKEAPQITDITVSGFGEAFLDPTLMKKITHARDMGYNIHVLTNGSKLNEDIIKALINTPVNDIRVSLHSNNVNHYTKITGARKEDYYNVMNSLALISLYKTEKTQLIVTCDIIEENKDDVDSIIEQIEPIVDLLEIWKPHNWIDWKGYRETNQLKTTCGRPFNGPLQIQVDGTINMCCFDYNGKLLLGNFMNESLEDIFNSKEYKDIVDAHNDPEKMKSSNLLCKNCDQLSITQGAVIYNNKYSEKDRMSKTSTNYRSVKK